jgi:hypothetical protein
VACAKAAIAVVHEMLRKGYAVLTPLRPLDPRERQLPVSEIHDD